MLPRWMGLFSVDFVGGFGTMGQEWRWIMTYEQRLGTGDTVSKTPFCAVSKTNIKWSTKTENKLYGRACGWTWIIWSCVSGKNRELQTMRLLDHPNVVALKHCFFSTTEEDELYLNLVLEYVPQTVHRVIKHYNKLNQRMPLIYVKLHTYQIFRSLSYIHHCIGVCHRDIKPQNLLVNPHTHQVKGEPNISYICSRYYRAPELVFGATEYTTAIDIWSAGCVLGELLLGQPLFPGESGVDQLVEIIKVLGTPTQEEIKCMNPKYTEFKFPQIKAHPWHKIFHKHMPPEAVDLVSRLLQYSPNLRCTALDALIHPFFDELRDPNTRWPNGRFLPPLFNFKSHELKGVPVEILVKLIPEHARKQCPFLGL
ncbi:hypothetical protein SLA2020_080300 [Shorea laevis]